MLPGKGNKCLGAGASPTGSHPGKQAFGYPELRWMLPHKQQQLLLAGIAWSTSFSGQYEQGLRLLRGSGARQSSGGKAKSSTRHDTGHSRVLPWSLSPLGSPTNVLPVFALRLLLTGNLAKEVSDYVNQVSEPGSPRVWFTRELTQGFLIAQ